MAPPDGLTLRELRDKPVTVLHAVGPRLSEQLGELSIATVLDLLEHYPRRYHDRTNLVEIASLTVGQEATVAGDVKKVSVRRPRGRRPIVELELFDSSSYLRLTFFNQEYRAKLEVGTEVSVFGRVEQYRGRRQMVNPALDVLGHHGDATTGVLLPVYPQSGKAGIHSWQLRRLVGQALERTRPRGFADPLDEDVRRAEGLIDRTTAYWGIHQPATLDDARTARQRLAFDEFLRIQVRLQLHRRAVEAEQTGIEHQVEGPLVDAFRAALPFALTGSQERALADIAADLRRPAPMHRLLQGEVGSGKTVVALSALLSAVQGGYQGAFLAPTEVLAEQHALTLRALVDGLTVAAPDSLLPDRPVHVALLTARTGAADRRRLAAGLRAGEVDIVVGTHALLEEGVTFPRLGLAVIDEQHRFGVEQRDLLRGKGDDPDVLVMTATPIPRTAAMLLYGDLDKSELRELPAGRAAIQTLRVGPSPLERSGVYERLGAEVAAGRQAYVVCPLVEGSERVVATAATTEYERLASEELAGLRLGLLHGQLPSAEKEAVMGAFRAHELDVLVATTVIEVGVDVANATVMVVEDADRFGLLQLHQLRGRIGRGSHPSWCFLLADPTTPEGAARLDAMQATTDGFELAERDLEIRGAGAVFGERQSGFSDLKLGRLPRDEPVIVEARGVAERLLAVDPDLREHAALRDEFEDLYPEEAAEFLLKS
ncbi:MAG TPA: ATP-dependent DNA helicase RecG [Acidimicrobiia bacterium]